MHVSAVEWNRECTVQRLDVGGVGVCDGRRPHLAAFRHHDLNRRMGKKLEGALRDRIEYRLCIGERTADHSEISQVAV